MFGNLSQLNNPQVWVDQTNVEAAAPLLVEYERERKRRQSKVAASKVSGAASIDVVCEECGKPTSFPASKNGTTQDCSHCGAFVDVGDEEPFDWSDS
jgi:hypothetical protein